MDPCSSCSLIVHAVSGIFATLCYFPKAGLCFVWILLEMCTIIITFINIKTCITIKKKSFSVAALISIFMQMFLFIFAGIF